MSSFNINDDNSNYNYIRIRNYSSENEHIKSCENSTCMMTDKNFLLVHTDFAENNTSIFLNEVNYENKVLSSLEVIKGENIPNMCFPINFQNNPEIYTIENVIKEYRKSFNNLILAGPTNFCPMIKKVIERIKI